jgi:hypothetical protein
MSGGREREGGARAGGSLLEHDDATDEGGPEGGARADGEGDEMGQLGGDEMRHPRRRSRSPPWWRSRIPRAARRGGGGRATLRLTVTHPSTTPSRATLTSCSALASENSIRVDLRERDGERARDDKEGRVRMWG